MKDVVHDAFREWCVKHDRTPLSKIAFGRHLGRIAKTRKTKLDDCKINVDGKDAHGYEGLTLKA